MTRWNTLLFDLDGTLIDTNDLIISSYEHVLTYYAPDQYSRDDIISWIGVPLADNFSSISSNPSQVEQMIDTYQSHNLANHETLVREYDGVYDTIKTLHERGFSLGIVTTKRKEAAVKGAEMLGLLPFFSTFVTVDDVTNPKPHPEPLQIAMTQLNARPEETIMVGDSQFDILAGKNAGVRTAGVAWTIKGASFLKNYEPDWMLAKMSDLLDIVGETEE
ncbi:pyrophosphatase PpaX [Marinococcus halophilus]|uniref:Pyrophosphatase PpaX n=1 Tax=Marinococcus halophilus TaxID=1371 RepID=A0A510Y6N9_MARHA|nr:pyrophosphatase PpaX [Marinococcus halophilus]OZT79675.1 pyrophosphatase PpaX [Marinococcus halophilus]GEK59029.1 pyrophosphatase PpaX [Marinococcus halophilus]